MRKPHFDEHCVCIAFWRLSPLRVSGAVSLALVDQLLSSLPENSTNADGDTKSCSVNPVMINSSNNQEQCQYFIRASSENKNT